MNTRAYIYEGLNFEASDFEYREKIMFLQHLRNKSEKARLSGYMKRFIEWFKLLPKYRQNTA